MFFILYHQFLVQLVYVQNQLGGEHEEEETNTESTLHAKHSVSRVPYVL